ncbi:tyrosine-protein phosphatase Lar isoform X4 [Folsomia candida]|uniref:tyrosine-protein phosphatase Lar isoform X4 n=1 Tax=Folsomia candida TaxID=158441 RepID=UPI001604CB78|nr:tyrosine-protein phosphatase Lar isoform X4 [Folsomia candida]
MKSRANQPGQNSISPSKARGPLFGRCPEQGMRPRVWAGTWLLAIVIFGVSTSFATGSNFSALYPYIQYLTHPPQIVEKPKDQRVKVGAIATFYCRVTGDPAPQVHWRKNGKKLTSVHSRINIQNFAGVSMLRIEPVRHLRDDASYECMAENGVGDPVTASANLTVFAEGEAPDGFPRITEAPNTRVVEKGRTATLICNASGMQPINIVWLKDLLPIQPSDRFQMIGPGGATLQIMDAGEADDGNYECIVENPVGIETSNSARLYVKERRVSPEFSVPPETLYEVMLNADLNLTCVAVGSPMPTVRWRKGVEDLTPDDAIPIGKNVLQLKNIKETAVYTCTATSKLGMKEANTTVKVQSLPKPPSKVRISDVTASSVRLTWSYESNEQEDVTYYVIQYKPKFSNQDYAEISGVLNQDHMITSLNPYTEYEFNVVAFNKVGRGEASPPIDATTGETRPKSAPRDVNARPLSSSQMLVNWQEPIEPNGQITGYKVFYTTNPTLPLAQWDAKRVESNEMTTIHDLIPRTIYTIRVQAYTAIGPGPVSAPIQAKTEQGVPGQPRNFRVSQVTPTSATMEWSKPNHIGDNIVGYELYWNDTFSKETSHRSISVGEQHILTNLYPNTMYFMWLAAKSRKGEGATTPPIPVRTEQYTPGAPPQKFLVEAEDSTSLRITWAPPPEDKQHGDIMYYKIYFVENHEPDALTKEITISNANTREYVINELRKWTEYKVSMLAGTSVGDGPLTEFKLIRTDEDVHIPGEPQNVSSEPLNSTTISIKWDSPNQNEKHGVIRGYQIHVQEIGEDGDSLLNQPLRFDVLDGNARFYNVSDLQPDTQYGVQVAALTRKGDGLRSKKVNVKTPGGVPSRPDLTLKVHNTETAVSVELEWTRPIQTFGEIHGFRVKYGVRNSPLEEVLLEGPKIHHHKLQKLERGVEYEFRVAASNHIGYGQEAQKYYTTPEGAPTGPPTNISYRFQTADVVAVTWEPPIPEERNGQILKYHVIFHRKMGLSTERNVSVTKAVFVALEENQEYWVQVSSATSQGKGPFSEKYSIKTEKEMIRAPTNVQAMSTSDSTAEVWWEGVPARGRLIGYTVFYTTTAVEDLDTWQTVSVPATTSADLINLEKNSQYAVAVVAKTKTGLGRLSSIVDNVRIKPEDVPLHLTADDLSTHSMTLRWARPVRLNPIEYKITYDAFKEFVDSDGMTQTQQFKAREMTVSQDREFITVGELSPFTTYNVNVTAVPPDHGYRPPAKITVTTHMAAPQPMVKPDACNQGGKIFLFLPQASEEYGPISHYYLVVVPDTKKLANKIPDQFLTDNMAMMSGQPAKVTIVGSYITEEDTEDDEQPVLNPYIAARFLPRAIPRNFQLGDGAGYNNYENKLLERNVKYRIFLRAIVDTPQKHLYTSSPFSDPITLSMTESHSCEPPSRPANPAGIDNLTTLRRNVGDHGVLWVVAPVIGVIFAACFMLICFLFKRRRVTHKHVDQSGVLKPLMASNDGPDGPMPTGYITSNLGIHTMGLDGNGGPECPSDPVEMRRMNFKSPAMSCNPPVLINDLSAHIERLKANDNHLFSQEYESVDPGQQFTWESSNLEVNKPKNRYANVVAYDHSRVVLQPTEGVPGSDYINANYCDGYRRHNAYIATQGPLPETFVDFWKMCWEVNTASIVMMTRLEERARVKCDQYWPSRGSETYGEVTVTLREVQELATYCIRSFIVRKTAPGMQQTREIKQLQFTAWPDHGVPDHPAPFLMFLRRVKYLNPPDCGPMIVHCSAGVGRTGCFIVIDSMLERMKYDNTVDIYGHVTCLRAQRNYMVQTEDQYIFIHDAIVEAIICGCTEIPADKLQAHLDMLTTLHPGESYTGLDIEFKKLSNMKIDPSRFLSANLPINIRKNRLVNILPFENTRVCLQPIRGVEGSDYINASFVDGYKDRMDRNAYIATQGPLPETVDDFWRMIWEHNSTIIVMLTKLREMGKEKCCHYWPNDRSQRYACFVVDPIAEFCMGAPAQYTLREFKITDARDGQSRTIRQFQFAEWPEQGIPKSAEGFIDFIGQVHKTKEQFGQEGPITVHCSAGVGRTGVFITLSIVLARIQSEDIVDLFQTVRILRTQRPAMVQSEDQYEFCYRAALEYLAYDQYA